MHHIHYKPRCLPFLYNVTKLCFCRTPDRRHSILSWLTDISQLKCLVPHTGHVLSMLICPSELQIAFCLIGVNTTSPVHHSSNYYINCIFILFLSYSQFIQIKIDRNRPLSTFSSAAYKVASSYVAKSTFSTYQPTPYLKHFNSLQMVV